MDKECLIIKEEYISCLDLCYDDEKRINFSVYNNSFFNYEDLKIIICLNDCIDVIEVSDNLKGEIIKNKIKADIVCFKPHSKISFYLKVRFLTFYSGYLNIVIVNDNYCVLVDKKICL